VAGNPTPTVRREKAGDERGSPEEDARGHVRQRSGKNEAVGKIAGIESAYLRDFQPAFLRSVPQAGEQDSRCPFSIFGTVAL
jgi:hypothetical protein